MGVGSFLQWIGGGLKRAAATAVVTGLCVVATGVMPWEAVVIVYVRWSHFVGQYGSAVKVYSGA